MVQVGISTLHGQIIDLWVDPNIVVSAFKQRCMDASPFHLTPLRINVDLAFLMKKRDSKPADSQHGRWDGVRVAHWDGRFLDDMQPLGSQVVLGGGGFLFKLVVMKQCHLDEDDKVLLGILATRTSKCVVRAPEYDTPFVAMAVWGGADREGHVLGLFYQHEKTDGHCSLQLHNVDPSCVSHATTFDLLGDPGGRLLYSRSSFSED